MAEELGISVKYLEPLVIPLKKAELIESQRGPKGGHYLAKPPDKITVGEVVKILEGNIDLSACVTDPNVCKRRDSCITRNVWEETTKVMYDKLNSITFAKMIEMENQT